EVAGFTAAVPAANAGRRRGKGVERFVCDAAGSSKTAGNREPAAALLAGGRSAWHPQRRTQNPGQAAAGKGRATGSDTASPPRRKNHRTRAAAGDRRARIGTASPQSLARPVPATRSGKMARLPGKAATAAAENRGTERPGPAQADVAVAAARVV